MIYDLIFMAETAVGVAAGLILFVGINALVDRYWRW